MKERMVCLWKEHRARVITVLVLIVLIAADCVQYARIEKAIAFGETCLGMRYVYGASGPGGYDCSGFVRTCMSKCGVTTPRYAEDIGYWNGCLTIESIEYLRRGDIVCFDTKSDLDLSDHVGIYLGDHKFIHASSAKGKVMISDLKDYYAEHFSWGKRPLIHL